MSAVTEAKLAELAANQWGLLTTAQAGAVGVRRSTVLRRAQSGSLDRMRPGVYRLSGAPANRLDEIRAAWNLVIGDFPLERLEFLQMLSGRYKMFLLTNTDQIHIAHFEELVGPTFAGDFYRCFEKVYYSYEMGMRKPDVEIFNYIIRKHDLSPKRTLFIDDKKENTDAAKQAGLQVWNLQVGSEDVVDLFDKKFENA